MENNLTVKFDMFVTSADWERFLAASGHGTYIWLSMSAIDVDMSPCICYLLPEITLSCAKILYIDVFTHVYVIVTAPNNDSEVHASYGLEYKCYQSSKAPFTILISASEFVELPNCYRQED